MRVRVVSTFPGKCTVQVVSKHHGRLIIHKHIGTFTTDTERELLLKKAHAFIRQQSGQSGLFDLPLGFALSDIAITESKPLFVYRLLSRIYTLLGFSNFSDPLIRDLVIARIYAPTSKRETKEILEDFFNCEYSLKTIYRHLKKSLSLGLKDSFQKSLIAFAKDGLGDSLRLVFYDVTTLYFESVAKEGLKDFGFSKDHRPMETQIVIGLVVNKQGFPLYFDIFNGRTFEGHTFIAVVESIKKFLDNPEFVIIADAAMISQDNVEKLVEKQTGFIVGARLANLPVKMQKEISEKLSGTDGKITTVTYHDQRLICQYMTKRANKDKHEREKQIERAKKALDSKSSVSSRFRFLKTTGGNHALNDELIKKAERLEGIKGYLTNTKLDTKTVIDRYHDLWRIENAFRLTKSDLEARPIFHRLDETITSHLVTVFAGLAISRYLEIKTGISIHKILKISGKVLTHKIINTKTGEEAYVETTVEDPELKEILNLLKSLGH